jgi:glycyl-tRNA synthetase
MFIVKKEIKGKKYYYLRASLRKDGKVVAKTVAYLGKTKKDAEKRKKEIEEEMAKGGSVGVMKDTKINKEEKVGKVMDEKKDNSEKKEITLDEMTAFCRRKGFVYASGEIYGGLAGFWDFGPLGSEMKKNLKDAWWKFHVHGRRDVVGIDGSIITNPKVWKASGHVDSFVDVAVVCKKCGNKFKVDKHELEDARCDKCGGDVDSKGEFNPMFTTGVGPIKDDSVEAYLRPETAQLIFADFKVVQENARMKLPFGIAQVGKSFRNEIAPRNFLFRSREFEQMEIEYFINPDEKENCPYVKDVLDFELNVFSAEMQDKRNEEGAIRMKVGDALKNGIIKLGWHGYWLATEVSWFLKMGANPDKIRVRQHVPAEKAHYATDTWDIEYHFPFGWKELQGVADRGTFDLDQHQKFSKKDMSIMDESAGKKVLPMVVAEPSLGVERAFLVFMFDAYTHDSKRDNVVLKLDPQLAPIKAAVFPLVKNDEKIVGMAEEVYDSLKGEWNVLYDKSGSVGRRYSRNDEIGTPYCITIDGDSISGKDVTIRDRDSTRQIRVGIGELKDVFRKLINGEVEFEKAGKLVETRVK